MNTLLSSYTFPCGQSLEIIQGSLTQETVDAIVNAANSHLAHGSGVARAIANAGGPAVQAESKAWVREHGPVSHAEPAYTSGGNMPCRYVIHAAGPIWGEGEEDRKLAEAIRGSLDLAVKLQLSSIAFPAISTGIFGFPKDRAARIFFSTLQDYYQQQPDSPVKLTRLVLWENESASIFAAEASRHFGSLAQ
jgi:O-acetyl-ADP-ribose deacetylase